MEDASLPLRFKAATGRSEAHVRRAYAWPYPFSQAPSQTLQYLFLCTPCKPAPVHTLHPVVSACCAHLPPEGLLQYAICAGAARLALQSLLT